MVDWKDMVALTASILLALFVIAGMISLSGASFGSLLKVSGLFDGSARLVTLMLGFVAVALLAMLVNFGIYPQVRTFAAQFFTPTPAASAIPTPALPSTPLPDSDTQAPEPQPTTPEAVAGGVSAPTPTATQTPEIGIGSQVVNPTQVPTFTPPAPSPVVPSATTAPAVTVHPQCRAVVVAEFTHLRVEPSLEDRRGRVAPKDEVLTPLYRVEDVDNNLWIKVNAGAGQTRWALEADLRLENCEGLPYEGEVPPLTPQPTWTPYPTSTPTPVTPEATGEITAEPTVEVTAEISATPVQNVTPTVQVTATGTATMIVPTATPTFTPSWTPTVTPPLASGPSATPTLEPTWTPTEVVPSATPTWTPTSTPSPTLVPPTATYTSTWTMIPPSLTPVPPTPTPVSNISLSIIVPDVDGAVVDSQVRIEAVAYDIAVGTSNGAGIRYVDFSIVDAAGTIIYTRREQIVRYCAGTGDPECQIIPALQGQSGQFTVFAQAVATSGVVSNVVSRTFVVMGGN
ncbi:MAG: hypothetical protein SF029_26900 [bacterium]|nr:hypothetical protein [bacterium]